MTEFISDHPALGFKKIIEQANELHPNWSLNEKRVRRLKRGPDYEKMQEKLRKLDAGGPFYHGPVRLVLQEHPEIRMANI